MSTSVSATSAQDLTAQDQASAAIRWLPVAMALAYPWALRAFHGAVASAGGLNLAAGVWLLLAFALPLSCVALTLPVSAWIGVATRRLALLGLAAPPLFVLIGVVAGLLGSPIKDLWIWSAFWIGLGVLIGHGRTSQDVASARPLPYLRIAHGVAAALILLFVTFHLLNHLAGLVGPELHARVMAAGRKVYRSPVLEPALVSLLLFQVLSGVRLAWRRSAQPLDLARMIQVGSGAYLAAFILTHMNSALVAARMVRGIQTDWAWATGAPEGLLLDAWNIRLVPHYALGVFFVVAHLFCGLRQVLLAHGIRPAIVAWLWGSGLAGAAVLATAITAGLCGLRL